MANTEKNLNVTTDIAKQNMVKARKGDITLPKIVGIAIGTGAYIDGNLLKPLPNENELKQEILRKPYDEVQYITEFCVRYRINLDSSELAGSLLNEIALYDENGDLVVIRAFDSIPKSSDMELSFEIEDTF